MKAILVIDMPKDCWDCRLVDEWGNCDAIKITSNKYDMSVKQNDKERPSWCPLKPMPQPKGYIDAIERHLTKKDSAMFTDGWNALLELIQNGEDSNE